MPNVGQTLYDDQYNSVAFYELGLYNNTVTMFCESTTVFRIIDVTKNSDFVSGLTHEGQAFKVFNNMEICPANDSVNSVGLYSKLKVVGDVYIQNSSIKSYNPVLPTSSLEISYNANVEFRSLDNLNRTSNPYFWFLITETANTSKLNIPSAGVYMFNVRCILMSYINSVNARFGVAISNSPTSDVTVVPITTNAILQQTAPVYMPNSTQYEMAFSFTHSYNGTDNLYVMMAMQWLTSNTGRVFVYVNYCRIA